MSYHCSLSQFSTPSGGKATRRGCPAWLLARLKEEQDRLFCVQPYPTLSAFCEANHLVLPQRGQGTWRLCARQVGHINGLWNSFGHLTATNGILCYIEQGNGVCFLGHLENFVQFKDEADEVIEAKPSVKTKAFAEFDL